MRRAWRAFALLSLPLLAACAAPGSWASNRIDDLADSVPFSVSYGWGFSASLRATPLLHVGLGLTPVVSKRWGYQDRAIHGYWKEYQATFPWSFFAEETSDLPPRPPAARTGFFDRGLVLVYRWQVRRDADYGEGEMPTSWEPQLRQWGRHPPTSMESGGALLIPEWRRELTWHDLRYHQGDPDPLTNLGAPEVASLWEASRDGPPVSRAWDLFEADLFVAFLGVRLGLRPVEFADFLLGIVGLDPLADDQQEPTATRIDNPGS